MTKHKIILGTVQFGLKYGINNLNGKPSFHEVFDILLKLQNEGINTLDTAEVYGNAQQLIGDFHETFPGKKFRVITKIPSQYNGSLEKTVLQYVETMKVEKLHALMFHSYDTLKNNETILKDMVALKSQGLINHIGVSIYTNEEFKEVLNYAPIEVIQHPFNLFDNITLRKELMQAAKNLGKIIHTRSSFLQGLFFLNENSKSPIALKAKPYLDSLRGISIKANISLHQLALNYCIQQELIDNVVIGVDSIGQLNSNLEVLTKPLDPSIIKLINNTFASIDDPILLNPSLWQTIS